MRSFTVFWLPICFLYDYSDDIQQHPTKKQPQRNNSGSSGSRMLVKAAKRGTRRYIPQVSSVPYPFRLL
jgi:hypothetical protein